MAGFTRENFRFDCLKDEDNVEYSHVGEDVVANEVEIIVENEKRLVRPVNSRGPWCWKIQS